KATASAELYSVSTKTFRAASAMNAARTGHTATRMPSGEVLIIGGRDETGADVAMAERYDPAKGTFASAGQLKQPRFHHTAAIRPSGQILIAGGEALGVAQPPGMEL